MPKKKQIKREIVATESLAEKLYEVKFGFNYADGDEEKRVDAGKAKPSFIKESDLPEGVFKELLRQGAIAPALEPEETGEAMDDPDEPTIEEVRIIADEKEQAQGAETEPVVVESK